jgi:hAT family C-terminal dimerisation region
LANHFGHKNPNDPESIFNRKPISLASILDSRYKLLFCPPGMKLALKGQIVDELSKLATAARSATSAAAASASGSYSQTARTSTDVSDVLSTTQSQPESAVGTEGAGVIKVEDVWQSVFDTFAAAAERVGQEGSNEISEDELETLTDQLDQYLSMPLLTPTGNPLVWWKEHAAQFPMLAKLARKYLATPASSAYSERLFSEYGITFEEKRSRLFPRTGEKILFLHHSLNRLDAWD